ncbi:hypothetical protein [Leptodesmis sichuanensis]|uniref:hypothetical protein n=1 Tax=Leptodesmis sichuanensis TaxID=2906798 RepID=UPI001F1955A1|nr:hypothetical protein [Leptodesmis sichuanensis]UIE36889.1 hypothetical protein KIK02_18005 [Leptodesmis sichuanensis A121]
MWLRILIALALLALFFYLSIKLAFSIFFFVLAVIILGLTTLNPSKIEEKFFINRNQTGLFLPLSLILLVISIVLCFLSDFPLWNLFLGVMMLLLGAAIFIAGCLHAFGAISSNRLIQETSVIWVRMPAWIGVVLGIIFLILGFILINSSQGRLTIPIPFPPTSPPTNPPTYPPSTSPPTNPPTYPPPTSPPTNPPTYPPSTSPPTNPPTYPPSTSPPTNPPTDPPCPKPCPQLW